MALRMRSAASAYAIGSSRHSARYSVRVNVVATLCSYEVLKSSNSTALAFTVGPSLIAPTKVSVFITYQGFVYPHNPVITAQLFTALALCRATARGRELCTRALH